MASSKFDKHTLNQGFYPILVLVVVCLVSTALLALTNEITMPARQAQAEKAELASKQLLFPEASRFESQDLPGEASDQVISLDLAYDSQDHLIGYLILAADKGYGGPVPMFVGIDGEGNLVGVDVPSNDETPGLGQKVHEESFYGQFAGHTAASRFTVGGIPNQDHEWVEIDAVTAATVSSTAATNAVNAALDLYNNLVKE